MSILHVTRRGTGCLLLWEARAARTKLQKNAAIGGLAFFHSDKRRVTGCFHKPLWSLGAVQANHLSFKSAQRARRLSLMSPQPHHGDALEKKSCEQENRNHDSRRDSLLEASKNTREGSISFPDQNAVLVQVGA